jgi:hypothetical protein
MKKKLFVLIGLISIIAMPCFAAGEYNVDNYFQNPGSGDDNNLIISGTQTVSGYLSITGNQNISGSLYSSIMPVFNAGLNINGNIIHNGMYIDEAQSVSKVTASSDTTITVTNKLIAITVTAPDAGVISTAHPLLSTTTATNYSYYRIILLSTNTFTIQDNDTDSGSLVELSSATQYTLVQNKWIDLFYYNGKYYQDDPIGMSTDNIGISGTLTAEQVDSTDDATIGDDLTLNGATESIILDSSGGGSGLIITEGLITPSDEELRLDSETQNVTIGDGTNDTGFGDDGTITQTGDAQANLLDVDIAGTGLTVDTIDDSGAAYISVSSDCVNTTGQWGVTTINGLTMYTVDVSTSLTNGEEFTFTEADGKAGMFYLNAGTYTVTGTFTSAAVVSLGAGSASVESSDTGSGLYARDGGTSVIIGSNDATTTANFYGFYKFQN